MAENDSTGIGGDTAIPARSHAPLGGPLATNSAEWLRVTLSCIGDGVITTDQEGRVTFLNTVAQALTGWTQAEAVEGGGVPIETLFRIISEATRGTVENPTVRALRDGIIVGLANHTILITRDGQEIPIDDSAAPIRNAKGETAGAVLVFRDVTEHKRQQRLAQHAKEYAENILATQREPFLVLDKSLRVVSANSAFYAAFRVEKETTEGRFVYDLGDGQWNIPRLRELLEEVVPRDHAFEGFEVEHVFPGGVGLKTMLLNVRKVVKPGNNSELILLAIEDITEQHRSQALLASQAEALELAADGATLVRVLTVLAHAAQRHCGADSRAAMFTVGADGSDLRFAVSAGMSAEYCRAVDHFVIGPDQPSCGTAAYTGATIIVPDVTKDARWAPWLSVAREHHIAACWSLPMLMVGGKVLGTLAMYFTSPREPGPGELDALTLLSRTAAILIERDREMQQRRSVEASLGESEVRFRRLFEAAKDGILILDLTTCRITDANTFMYALTGMEPGELIGKELFEIGMFEDVEANKESFRELQRTGYLRHDHLPLRNRQGGEAEVEFIANVYREGENLVAQCNIRDISDRSRLEKEVAKQAEALAAQARAKDEFLAMLSHELRNPLAPIRAAAHMMRLQEENNGSAPSPIMQQAREIIERQVTNLTKMVSDLSEVSRVISGRIRMDLEPVNVNQAVKHAIQTVSPIFEQRTHSVSVNLTGEPLWVLADRVRLEEVLVNLLHNAAKYTANGGRIGVSCELLRESGLNHAIVRVSDNGVGIDEALLPRVFDLFTQADRSLARSSGGLGIGLSLAKRLVALHGGTIWAESEGPGKGSEFIVKLPMTASPVGPPAIDQQPPDAEDGLFAKTGRDDMSKAAMRVLVVDDNIDLVTMLCATLRHRGFTVKSAYTGPDGLRIAQQWQPDIALLDIGLPGLDGYEIARRLRAAEALLVDASDTRDAANAEGHARIRLIAITGYGREDDAAHARDAGFDGHLVKPCDLDLLEKMMNAPTLRM